MKNDAPNKKYMSMQPRDLNSIQHLDKTGNLMLYSTLISAALHVHPRCLQAKNKKINDRKNALK